MAKSTLELERRVIDQYKPGGGAPSRTPPDWLKAYHGKPVDLSLTNTSIDSYVRRAREETRK